jgi:hypothetical protein
MHSINVLHPVINSDEKINKEQNISISYLPKSPSQLYTWSQFYMHGQFCMHV